MDERRISGDELLSVIETGDVFSSDSVRAWIYKTLPGRDDNLVCAVVVLEDVLVVKTVMHRWQVLEG